MNLRKYLPEPAALLSVAPPLIFFFISGACGLVYQVVWTRKLVLLFGTTAYAVSTVLAVFFIGLAAGSLLGGRWADRVRRPLVLYGVFEIVIGLWALFFILLVGRAEVVAVGLLSAWGHSRAAGIALRAVLAAGLLLVPVVMMGATLPLLARHVVDDVRLRGRRVGALYSINTFGAVLGCALAGFVLLPALGYTRTTVLGVEANIGVGVLAIILGLATNGRAGVIAKKVGAGGNCLSTTPLIPPQGGKESVTAADSACRIQVSSPDQPVSTLEAGQGTCTDAASGQHEHEKGHYDKLILFVYAVSGFCALAYEVLWTRLLVLVFLGTTYAFTTMLSTLLLGIALGSAAAARFADKRRHAGVWFGAIQILIGAAAVAMLIGMARLPQWVTQMQIDAGFKWEATTRAKFIASFLVLFPPTFLFGMTFPFVVRALTESRARLGKDVGRLYAANTFGGVLGALAGGFLLIPFLWTQNGIVALSVTMAVAGALAIVLYPRLGMRVKFAAIAPCAAAFGLALYFMPARIDLALNKGYLPADQEIIYYNEGAEGTVAVSATKNNDTGTNRTLWVNAMQATASIEKGVKMNRFEGFLPLLFDRDPRRVLFMCFGSGITAGALGLYGYDRIDAVEICPEVLDAAPLFARDNLDVVKNPRVHFTVDDGRNFLLTTRDRYDVITFEPMPLAMAGVSTFYTREYYELCRARLTPGGLVSQWVPLHSLDYALVQALVATFVSVFPESTAWFVNADLFIVGSNQPLRIDYAKAEARLRAPAIQAAVTDCGLYDAVEVVSCFFMGKEMLRKYAAGAPVMSDDRPWAEFVAPKLVYARTVEKSLMEIAPYLESPSPYLVNADDGLRAAFDRRAKARAKDLEGLQLYYGGTFGSQPEQHFQAALEIDPQDKTALFYLKEIVLARVDMFVKWEEPEKALEVLNEALKYAPDHPDLLARLKELQNK